MKLRMQITKERDIRFISHLEYVRTLERAIRRAKLPAAYSEGFNPHMKFALASALGVGVVSYTEFLEIELYEDMDVRQAAEALAKTLPRGIRVLMADRVEKHHAALMAEAAGAAYKVALPLAVYGDGSNIAYSDVVAAVSSYNETAELLFKKSAPKSKLGYKEIDVKFFIPELRVEEKDGQAIFEFECKITPTGSMKAVDLLRALNERYGLQLPVEMADIERHRLYRLDRNGRKIGMLNTDAVRLA